MCQKRSSRQFDLLNPYNPKNFKNDKLSILDIKATAENGQMFNVEIQVSDEEYYDKRALYYWAKLYTGQLQDSDDYGKLKKTIGIHILNFVTLPDVEEYHNVFHIVEKTKGFPYSNDLELHTLELKKFTHHCRSLTTLVKKIKSSLDMWLAFLTRHNLLKTNLDNQILLPTVETIPLKKALHILDVMNFTDEERQAYDDHLKWLRMEVAALNKAIKTAEARGEKRGEARGILEGHTSKTQHDSTRASRRL